MVVTTWPLWIYSSIIRSKLQYGSSVFENTEVMDINYEQDSVEVTTSFDIRWEERRLLLLQDIIQKDLLKRNFGVKTVTYNIATKPVENFDGWFNRVLIRDNCEPYNYFRTTVIIEL